jgi:hypothetical protein
MELTNRDVYTLFKDVKCPYCGENIDIDMVNQLFPFTGFQTKENAKKECKEFTQELNQLLLQVRSDALSREDLSRSLEQYSSKL